MPFETFVGSIVIPCASLIDPVGALGGGALICSPGEMLPLKYNLIHYRPEPEQGSRSHLNGYAQALLAQPHIRVAWADLTRTFVYAPRFIDPPKLNCLGPCSPRMCIRWIYLDGSLENFEASSWRHSLPQG